MQKLRLIVFLAIVLSGNQSHGMQVGIGGNQVSFIYGNTCSINWSPGSEVDYNNFVSYTIQVADCGETNWNTIATILDPYTYQFDWIVNVPLGSYAIRVIGNFGVIDAGVTPNCIFVNGFPVPTITSPVAGDNFVIGEPETISWSLPAYPHIESFLVKVYFEGGGSETIADLTGSSRSFTWNVPDISAQVVELQVDAWWQFGADFYVEHSGRVPVNIVEPTLWVSGRVYYLNEQQVPTGIALRPRIVDANGNVLAVASYPTGVYGFSVEPGWSGVFTAKTSLVGFSPESRSLTNVQDNTPNQDFVRSAVNSALEFTTLASGGNGYEYFAHCPVGDVHGEHQISIDYQFVAENMWQTIHRTYVKLRIRTECGSVYVFDPVEDISAANNWTAKYRISHPAYSGNHLPQCGQGTADLQIYCKVTGRINGEDNYYPENTIYYTGWSSFDLNFDGTVDIVDLGELSQVLGMCRDDDNWDSDAQCANFIPHSSPSGDCVNLADYFVFGQHYTHGQLKRESQTIRNVVPRLYFAESDQEACGLWIESKESWKALACQIRVSGLASGAALSLVSPDVSDTFIFLGPVDSSDERLWTLLAVSGSDVIVGPTKLCYISATIDGKPIQLAPASLEIVSVDAIALDDLMNTETLGVAAGTDKPLQGIGVVVTGPDQFHRTSLIDFSFPRTTHATAIIYDIRGRHVRTLINDTVASGSFQIEWDGRNAQGSLVAAGVYLLSTTTSDSRQTTRLMVLR